MKPIWLSYFIVHLLFVCGASSAVEDDLEIVRNRVISELLADEIDERHITVLVNSIKNDGTWPGINYQDVSRTGFEHGRHLTNMVDLCVAYKKKSSSFYRDPKIKNTINVSLDYWLKNDFICDNWWWNQLGTPREMVKVLLILDEDVTVQQKKDAAPIVGRAHLGAWGARPSGDRIKIAGIQAKHLLFQRNKMEFDSVIRVIESEIKFVTGRGMQYDYSFHHRTDRVNNTLSYGKGYADAFAEWAAYVSGTTYAFSDDKLNHLIDYYLDGICKMMVFGKYPDPGAKNRSISRKGTLDAWNTVTPEHLLKATNYRQDELKEIIEIRKGEADPSVHHNTFYWLTDHFAHQRSHFFTSVRMYSVRNHNMEIPYNGEGLKNHHLADGSNFISRTGKEYYDIAPVFDWQKIPGTTILQKQQLPDHEQIQKPGLTKFVGSVTDGMYGAAAFNFVSPHDTLKAKKSWFCFDDAYVCLGAGIHANGNLPVVTTLNQCLLHDTVISMQNKRTTDMQHGEHELSDVNWILHDSVGYIFPKPSMVHLFNSTATGNWRKVNIQTEYTDKSVKKDIFKLWLDHGVNPENATYQYVVVPGVGQEELEAKHQELPVEILENNEKMQAVKHNSLGIYQIVFYEPGSISLGRDLELSLKDAGLVMVTMQGDMVSSVSVADPTHELSEIRMSISKPINFTTEKVKSTPDEKTGLTNLEISLPQGIYSGKTVVLKTN